MNQNTQPMAGGQIPPNRTPQQPPRDDNGDYGDTQYHVPPPVPGESGGHSQLGPHSLHSSLHPQDTYTAQVPRPAPPSQGAANSYSASRSFPSQDPAARPTHGVNPYGNLPAHPHSGPALAAATGHSPFYDPTYSTQLPRGSGSYALGTAHGNSSFADSSISYPSETTPGSSYSVNPGPALFPHGNTLARGATDRWVSPATRNVRSSQGPYSTHLPDPNLPAPTGNNAFLDHPNTPFAHGQSSHGQISHPRRPLGQQFSTQSTYGPNPHGQMSHQGSAMGQHFSTQNMSGQNPHGQSSTRQAHRAQSGYGHATGERTHLQPSYVLPPHGQGPYGQNSQYQNPYFADPSAQGTTPAAQSPIAQGLAAQSQYRSNSIAPAPPQTPVHYSAPRNPFSGRPTARITQEARALPGVQQSLSAGQHPTPKRKRAPTPAIPASALSAAHLDPRHSVKFSALRRRAPTMPLPPNAAADKALPLRKMRPRSPRRTELCVL